MIWPRDGQLCSAGCWWFARFPASGYFKTMKLLLFKAHQGDPLGGAIRDITRTPYTHAAVLKDEATNTISEAFFPHVRERVLENSELAGIDVFDVSSTWPTFTPLTADQVAKALAHCANSEAEQESYAVTNLFRFLPGVEKIIGDVKDDGTTSPVICSQYAFDVFDAAGVQILNTASDHLAPGYLAWSPLVFPAQPLKLLVQAPQKAAGASFLFEAIKVAEYASEAVKPIVEACK